MKYTETSKFQYENTDEEDKIDEKIFFRELSPEELSIVTEYYELLNSGKVDEAIELINSSNIYNYNAALFNRILNILKRIGSYYLEKYWDSSTSSWKEKNETTFQPNGDMLLLSDYNWNTDETIYEMKKLDFEYMDWVSGDFDNYYTAEFVNSKSTSIELGWHEDDGCIFTSIPCTLKRGNYRFYAMLNNKSNRYSTYKKCNINVSVLCGLYGNDELGKNILPQEEPLNNGYGKNITIAYALKANSTKFNDVEGLALDLSDSYDSDYSDVEEVNDHFDIVISMRLPSGYEATYIEEQTRQLIKHGEIKFYIVEI